jgi:hypothetical protein
MRAVTHYLQPRGHHHKVDRVVFLRYASSMSNTARFFSESSADSGSLLHPGRHYAVYDTAQFVDAC